MDDLELELQRQAAQGEQMPADLGWVVNRGRGLRRRRLRGIVAAGVLATTLVGVAVVATLDRLSYPTPTVTGPTRPADEATDGVLYEHVSESRMAEIFAFRAVARIGLMDPYGNPSYNVTNADDTENLGRGRWGIGFVRSNCIPGGTPTDPSFTCGSRGGSFGGTPEASIFIEVELRDGQWEVIGVDGDMRQEDTRKLLGFSLPAEEEPSHWEFPSIGIFDLNGGAIIEGFPLWVGPVPTRSPASECTFVVRNAVGDVTFQETFSKEPPEGNTDGGIWGLGNVPVEDVAEAVVDCVQGI